MFKENCPRVVKWHNHVIASAAKQSQLELKISDLYCVECASAGLISMFCNSFESPSYEPKKENPHERKNHFSDSCTRIGLAGMRVQHRPASPGKSRTGGQRVHNGGRPKVGSDALEPLIWRGQTDLISRGSESRRWHGRLQREGAQAGNPEGWQ